MKRFSNCAERKIFTALLVGAGVLVAMGASGKTCAEIAFYKQRDCLAGCRTSTCRNRCRRTYFDTLVNVCGNIRRNEALSQPQAITPSQQSQADAVRAMTRMEASAMRAPAAPEPVRAASNSQFTQAVRVVAPAVPVITNLAPFFMPQAMPTMPTGVSDRSPVRCVEPVLDGLGHVIGCNRYELPPPPWNTR